MTSARPAGFNELLHFPVRLTIVSLLAPAAHVEFSYLREATGLSDSALSKQLTSLQEAGYVEVRRTGRRATARLTGNGRQALNDHAIALRTMLGNALDTATPASTSSAYATSASSESTTPATAGGAIAAASEGQ